MKNLVRYLCMAASAFVLASQAHAEDAFSEEPFEFEAYNGETIDTFRGRLQVLENRNDPDSRTIEIGYVRFPAVDHASGPPIIYLAGGPGGAGTSAATGRRFHLFMAMREFGDVIAFDQRGTGLSQRLPECGSTGVHLPYDELMTHDRVSSAFSEAMSVCAARWQSQGIDITSYNTQQSATDIVELLDHLNEEKAALWGISYGTHLGFELVRQLGDDRISRIVFTGVEGPNHTVKLPARTDAYFERVEQAIAQHPDLDGVPDLTDLIHTANMQLDTDLPEVELQHPETGETVNLVFSSVELRMMATQAIADPDSIPRLVQVYSLAAQGEYERIGSFIIGFLRTQTEVEISGMPEFTDLASGITADRLALVNEQAETSLFADYLNFPMPHILNSVPSVDLGDDFRADVSSGVPTLLLSGTLDGRTYPESQLEAMEGFSDLSVVTVVNGGHNLFMATPEISETIADFMRGDFHGDRTITISVEQAFED